MAQSLLGYNILLKATVGSVEKYFAATKSNNFAISPEIKESVTKDDRGVKRKVFTGYSWEMGIEGIVSVKDSGETDVLDKDDLIAMAKAGTLIEVVYGSTATGSKVQKGTAIITAYSENSEAEEEATYSATLGGMSPLVEATIA